MEIQFKTIKLTKKEAITVATYLKVSKSDIEFAEREGLLWEITRKTLKGADKETLVTIAKEYKVELLSKRISDIKMYIEQDLGDQKLALVPATLPSLEEIVEEAEKEHSQKEENRKHQQHERLIKQRQVQAERVAKAKEATLLKQQEAQSQREAKARDREQERLLKQQQAQAKKTAKTMGKMVGGLLGGVGSMFKETKAQKAQRKWHKRSTNTFNTK